VTSLHLPGPKLAAVHRHAQRPWRWQSQSPAGCPMLSSRTQTSNLIWAAWTVACFSSTVLTILWCRTLAQLTRYAAAKLFSMPHDLDSTSVPGLRIQVASLDNLKHLRITGALSTRQICKRFDSISNRVSSCHNHMNRWLSFAGRPHICII